MIDQKTSVERELDTIRRELRELTYSVNRVLRVLEAAPAQRLAPESMSDIMRPIDPNGLFAEAQAETQGRVLEEPVVPPDSARPCFSTPTGRVVSMPVKSPPASRTGRGRV